MKSVSRGRNQVIVRVVLPTEAPGKNLFPAFSNLRCLLAFLGLWPHYYLQISILSSYHLLLCASGYQISACLFFSFLFFPFGCSMQESDVPSQFPDQGLSPGQSSDSALTTKPPGSSPGEQILRQQSRSGTISKIRPQPRPPPGKSSHRRLLSGPILEPLQYLPCLAL